MESERLRLVQLEAGRLRGASQALPALQCSAVQCGPGPGRVGLSVAWSCLPVFVGVLMPASMSRFISTRRSLMLGVVICTVACPMSAVVQWCMSRVHQWHVA